MRAQDEPPGRFLAALPYMAGTQYYKSNSSHPHCGSFGLPGLPRVVVRCGATAWSRCVRHLCKNALKIWPCVKQRVALRVKVLNKLIYGLAKSCTEGEYSDMLKQLQVKEWL